MSARVRSRETAVWQTLAAKERLCEQLDSLVRSNPDTAAVAAQPAAARERWADLPALPAAWEKQLATRRDAALNALSDVAAAGDYRARVERGIESRRESLLELELLLGLDSPAEFQAQRLALQLKQLRERFKGAAAISADAAGERLVAWCGEPGVADAGDRQRCERIFTAAGKAADAKAAGRVKSVCTHRNAAPTSAGYGEAGANDGIVSTASLVVGVAAAHATRGYWSRSCLPGRGSVSMAAGGRVGALPGRFRQAGSISSCELEADDEGERRN